MSSNYLRAPSGRGRSQRLEEEVVEGLQEYVVEHHHHLGLRDLPEAFVDQDHYIREVL